MNSILFFSNCHGNIIKIMFEYYLNQKINYISNFLNITEDITDEHINFIKNCDIFIYQPFNNLSTSKYSPEYILPLLKDGVITIKVNYYRFHGFWPDSNYSVYNEHKLFKYSILYNCGMHDSFKDLNLYDYDNIKNKIDSIELPNYDFSYYLEKLKELDTNSDVKMYDYFINNYKNLHLFHDGYHPTNIFIYEIFRQLILKIKNINLKENDFDFINIFKDNELTHWAIPILPIVKNIIY